MEEPMLKQLSFAALALVALPAVAGAQPLDPYGRPYVMSPPQPSPGDPQMSQRMPMRPQPMPMQDPGAPMYGPGPSQAMAPADTGGTMRDEYGNLYNSRGDRIDRSGRIIPPPVTPPGARAYR
jgi:hypothetical protein